jgi:hypothetical protein
VLPACRNKHLGQRAFLVGTGPSIRSQDLSMLRQELVFSCNWIVNYPDVRDLQIDYLCAYDPGFIEPEVNQEWFGQVKLANPQNLVIPNDWPDVPFMEDRIIRTPQSNQKHVGRDKCFSVNVEEGFYDGSTVIINICLPLAIYMGISEIILLGCECDYGGSQVSTGAYFYELDAHKTRFDPDLERQRLWQKDVLSSYDVINQYCIQNGIAIYNATPGGALESIPRVDFTQIIEASEGSHLNE